MTDLTRSLMIHVERIVRPVRATERRKLSMRRELLAHLTAALDEERTAGHADAAAFESAKLRLGAPADLTRSLQATVPFAERLFLAYLPLPARFARHEMNMSRQMGMAGLPLAQQALFTFGAFIPTCATLVLLGLLARQHHHDQLLRSLAERSPLSLLGIVTSQVLLLAIMGACFAIVGAGAKQKPKSPAWYGLWLTAFIVGWHVAVIGLIAGAVPQPLEWLAPLVAAPLLAFVLAALGRFTRRIGRDYRQWLTLDIA
jgi:hypothetical protein